LTGAESRLEKARKDYNDYVNQFSPQLDALETAARLLEESIVCTPENGPVMCNDDGSSPSEGPMHYFGNMCPVRPGFVCESGRCQCPSVATHGSLNALKSLSVPPPAPKQIVIDAMAKLMVMDELIRDNIAQYKQGLDDAQQEYNDALAAYNAVNDRLDTDTRQLNSDINNLKSDMMTLVTNQELYFLAEFQLSSAQEALALTEAEIATLRAFLDLERVRGEDNIRFWQQSNDFLTQGSVFRVGTIRCRLSGECDKPGVGQSMWFWAQLACQKPAWGCNPKLGACACPS